MAVASVLLSSCVHPAKPFLAGPALHAPAYLSPDAAPGGEARLTMGAVTMPVKVVRKVTPDLIELRLLAHGEPIDLEGYRSLPTEFGVVYAEGERYEPPIPLLRFPMTVGDSWTWNGHMAATGTERPVSAEIVTSIGKVTMPDGPREAVRVDVRLKMPTWGDAPAGRRTLDFWFIKGLGVVRREFGSESIREPMSPGATN